MNRSLHELETHGSVFLSPLNQIFSAQRGQQPPLLPTGPVPLLRLAPASLLESERRHRGCRNASAPKRALGTERTSKPEMLSLKTSESKPRSHLIAHIATAALGIFISFALLLLP